MLARLGVITPVAGFTGMEVGVGPTEVNVPPGGVNTTACWAEVLHRLGIGEIVGVSGLNAVTARVFVIGQLTSEGVTVMLYITVTGGPGAMLGEMMVFCRLVLPPASQVLGVQE